MMLLLLLLGRAAHGEDIKVNYASMDAGALVLETSPTSSGFSNLLIDDKDKYGITPCANAKMVVIGLSEDIQAREIVLAQYEKYSSGVKGFEVWGSSTFPPATEWFRLGQFEATPEHGEQAFALEFKWIRYVKVVFLTHYGDEYSCTVSQIKMHGLTMAQDFREDEVEDQGEELLQKESITSLSCLQLLDPAQFRARMRTNATASEPSSFLEPVVSSEHSIFKTFMDKIKAFEQSQAITDLYLERLHSCYTQSILDIERSSKRPTVQSSLSVQDALVFATLAFVACFFAILISSCLLCFRNPHHTNHYHYYSSVDDNICSSSSRSSGGGRRGGTPPQIDVD